MHEAQRRGIEVLPPCVEPSDRQSVRRQRAAGADGAGLRERRATRREVRSLVEERARPWLALGRGPRLAVGLPVATLEQARLGGRLRLRWSTGPRRGGGARRCGCSGSPLRGVPVGRGGEGRDAARAAARPARRARAARARRLGPAARRLRLDRRHDERAPDGADAARPARARASRAPSSRRSRDGSPVTIAGLVIARQRPATAKGVTFMLLEDEHGTLNLIVPPPVHERCRLAVRGEPLVIADGRLERREGIVNVAGRTTCAAWSAATCRRPRCATSSRRARGAARRAPELAARSAPAAAHCIR